MTPERALRFHPRTDMWKGLWIKWGCIHRLRFFGVPATPSPWKFCHPNSSIISWLSGR